jgi:hypothetical protein
MEEMPLKSLPPPNRSLTSIRSPRVNWLATASPSPPERSSFKFDDFLDSPKTLFLQ